MSPKLQEKLARIANIIAKGKQQLHLVAVIRSSRLSDRWDFIISSDSLVPHSHDAIKYVADLLKKNLTTQELIKIARIVVLSPSNRLVATLVENPKTRPDELNLLLHASDRFDMPPIVLWPPQAAPMATSGADLK